MVMWRGDGRAWDGPVVDRRRNDEATDAAAQVHGPVGLDVQCVRLWFTVVFMGHGGVVVVLVLARVGLLLLRVLLLIRGRRGVLWRHVCDEVMIIRVAEVAAAAAVGDVDEPTKRD